MKRLLIIGTWLTLINGCMVLPDAAVRHPEVEPYLGVYRGSFDTALTEDPADDLNYNPCNPGKEEENCLIHHAPLVDILLELRRTRDGEVGLAFFRTEDEFETGRPLDLLGRGCGTRIGTLTNVETVRGHDHTVASFPISTDNQLCLGKLRPISHHQVNVELHADTADRPRQVRVLIDKKVHDANYLYLMENGVRKRVRIDRDNTLRDGNGDRYRVCIEGELGEYERCVLTDREFRSFALPIPVPGGVGINYTWWQEVRPRLQRTRGLYEVDRYVGRFDLVELPDS